MTKLARFQLCFWIILPKSISARVPKIRKENKKKKEKKEEMSVTVLTFNETQGG